MGGNLGRFLRGVADVLLPPLCPLCRGLSEDGFFCTRCLEGFHPLREPCCERCGLPFAGVGPSHACPRCRDDPPPFLAVGAWGRYEDNLLRALRGFKYRRQIWMRRALEDLFVSGFDRYAGGWAREIQTIVPVPCSGRALRRRGFDLPSLISRRLALARDLRWRPRALIKARGAQDLVGLGVTERLRAAAAVYGPGEALVGGVLLVDDVVTTTATARACSQACLEAGADHVFVLALARTPLEVLGT